MPCYNVVIVGAGLGGLAAALALSADGHKVTVLDSAPQFAEAGAGIRVPPNSARLLLRWGVDFNKMKKSVSERYHFVRWSNGSTITQFEFGGDAQATYGAGYYLVHRADLHQALFDAAVAAGATIHTDSAVMKYDFTTPSVTVKLGKTYTGDLVIAADGIKSIAREELLGKPENPRDTGDVAYRILIDGQKLLADPDLKDLIERPCTTSWCGPDAHLVGYPIRNGELYNIVVCATAYDEFGPEDGWVIQGNNEELVSRFSSWTTQVQKLCKLTTNFLKWKLCDLAPLDHWMHPAGKVALLGDSCHPMLPYLAQGAAQAVEDAAALRTLLNTSTNIKSALQQYESIRIPRTARIQANTRKHQHILHVEDGLEQQERDERMKDDCDANPVFWGSSDRRTWLFSHDAEKVTAPLVY